MNIIKKIKNILFDPSNFFSKVTKEKGIKEPFIYLLILSLFSVGLASIGMLLFPKLYFLFNIGGTEIEKTAVLLIFIFGFVVSVLGSFIAAAILYIWLYIFKGRRKYEDAYKLQVYSRTPSLVIGWLPFIGFLASIYSFVLLVIGTHKMYKFSPLKATLIYLIPLVAAFFIAFVVAFVIMLIFASKITPGVGF